MLGRKRYYVSSDAGTFSRGWIDLDTRAVLFINTDVDNIHWLYKYWD